MSLADHYRASLTSAKLLQDPELLLVDPAGFGLRTATPVQRACAWLLAQKPIPNRLWDVSDVQAAFGGVRPFATPDWKCNEFAVLAGVRSAKTTLAAMAAVFSTQNVNLSTGPGAHMIAGEVPRVSVVSERSDLAAVAFGYIKGAVMSSPALKGLLVGEPTADTITLRHPSGRPIEVCVIAGSRAGASLVARWCAGMIFDEAPRMASEQDGVVNLKEMRTAVRGRILDGAFIFYPGSPWGNVGTLYDMFQQNWQKPSPSVFFVKAPGTVMNPIWWTPERAEELRLKDPDAYKTDVLAEFRDPESAMYSSASVDLAMHRTELVLPPEDGKTYTAAMDPGTRGNAWSFGIAETEDNVRFKVMFVKEFIGSQARPLVPSEVFREMAPDLQAYRCSGSVKTDQWAVDALRELALQQGIGLSPLTITSANKVKLYESIRVRLDSHFLDLPPDTKLRSDLLGVKKRLTGDGFKVVLPETADGRHCDYAAMLALLCGDYLQSSTEERYHLQRKAAREALEDDDDVDWSPREEEEEYDNRDPDYLQ